MRADSENGQRRCFRLDTALAVLLAGRELIHLGWRLLHHPLYGNYRPYQQPYRSLILDHPHATAPDSDGLERIIPHDWSLHLMEEALNVYQCAETLSPEEAPPSLRADCAILDFELMRLPLVQAGWPDDLGPKA